MNAFRQVPQPCPGWASPLFSTFFHTQQQHSTTTSRWTTKYTQQQAGCTLLAAAVATDSDPRMLLSDPGVQLASPSNNNCCKGNAKKISGGSSHSASLTLQTAPLAVGSTGSRVSSWQVSTSPLCLGIEGHSWEPIPSQAGRAHGILVKGSALAQPQRLSRFTEV